MILALLTKVIGIVKGVCSIGEKSFGQDDSVDLVQIERARLWKGATTFISEFHG